MIWLPHEEERKKAWRNKSLGRRTMGSGTGKGRKRYRWSAADQYAWRMTGRRWQQKGKGYLVSKHPEKKEKDLSLQLLCIFLLSNGTIKSDTFLSIYKSCIEPRTQAVFSLTWSKLHGKHPWPTASLQCKNLSVLCSSPGLFLQKTSKQRRAKVVFYRLVEHVLDSWRVLRKFISWRIMRITLLSVCKG